MPTDILRPTLICANVFVAAKLITHNSSNIFEIFFIALFFNGIMTIKFG